MIHVQMVGSKPYRLADAKLDQWLECADEKNHWANWHSIIYLPFVHPITNIKAQIY